MTVWYVFAMPITRVILCLFTTCALVNPSARADVGDDQLRHSIEFLHELVESQDTYYAVAPMVASVLVGAVAMLVPARTIGDIYLKFGGLLVAAPAVLVSGVLLGIENEFNVARPIAGQTRELKPLIRFLRLPVSARLRMARECETLAHFLMSLAVAVEAQGAAAWAQLGATDEDLGRFNWYLERGGLFGPVTRPALR